MYTEKRAHSSVTAMDELFRLPPYSRILQEIKVRSCETLLANGKIRIAPQINEMCIVVFTVIIIKLTYHSLLRRGQVFQSTACHAWSACKKPIVYELL